MMKAFFACFCLAAIATAALGAVFLDESFDYGGPLTSGDPLTDTGVWTGNTALIFWDDFALSYPAYGGDSDGSASYSFHLATSRQVVRSFDTPLNYSNYTAGDTLWFTALFHSSADGGADDVARLTFNHEDTLNSNTSVNRLQMEVRGTTVTFTGFGTGGAGDYQSRSISGGIASGQTHLFVARLTKGTGTGALEPVNSVWDFWVDPTDISSVSALGLAHASILASKAGRNDPTLNYLIMEFGGWTDGESPQWDEVRVSDSYFALVVPEPSTLMLMGIAGVIARRRPAPARR